MARRFGLACCLSFVLLTLALAGCSSCPEEWSGDNRITQIATIDSLLSGVYDGWYSVDELRSQGDLGIGTFDALDGELIMLDGKIYKLRADGRVYPPETGETTPFAAVASFNPESILLVGSPVSMSELQTMIDRAAPRKNLPAVIRVEGDFEWVKVRSVPRQEKPYPPLVKITAKQAEFMLKNLSGYLVGFRLPAYVKGINVPGYHLHFISDRFDCGGHVLELRLRSGKIMIGNADRITVLLPRFSDAFANADLSKDRSRELSKAEK